MSDITPSQLGAVLDGLQTRMEGALLANRSAVAHPGARGGAAEEDWIGMLGAHLPQRYVAARAFVIDSQGGASDQIDVVIFDRQYSPLLYNHAGQLYVPAEAVYAVLEVKQEVSRETIQYAGAKAHSVRQLHRTSAPIPYAEGTYQPRPLHRLVAGLLAYRSSWTPPFGAPFRRAIGELEGLAQLDLGCALIHGAFSVASPGTGNDGPVVEQGGRSLVMFFLRLLERLQNLGTAPAIDYAAYLAHLSGLAPPSRPA